MSAEKNKAIVRRWSEALNKGNLAALDKLVAPDYVDHTEKLRGPEELKQHYTTLLKGFPDAHVTIKDIIAEGDKVWIQVKVTLTHTGEYRGIAPTDKKMILTGVQMWRIVDGKVVERTSVYDQLDFFKQLGVIEYTEKAKELFPEHVS